MRPDELERLRPSDGARFLLALERELDGGTRARYHGWVLTPTTMAAYVVELADAGTASVNATGTPAAPEHAAMLETIGKLTARAAAKRRDDGMPPWPPRVLRWRGAGRGS